jgi:formate hydrogenlyase subunit 3/multisubunit Na+/H+ antiporter MnhD subunit
MSLLACIAACGIGAVVALAARPVPLLARLAGLGGLAAAFLAALLVGPATRLTVGDVTLSGSEFSGFFLACAAGSAFLLCVVGLGTKISEELAPAALASFAGLAVAMTSSNPGVALVAGAAAATAGALLMIHSAPVGSEDDGRLAELRTAGMVAAGLGFAAMAIVRPAWNGQNDGPVFGPAFLGLGLALAVRGGAVPFHVPAARLGRTAAPFSPALLLVWVPAGLGILAVSWSATTFGIQSDWLNVAVSVVQTVAVATLILGGLAALVHDELEEIVAYSIVADAGFVLLAMAARNDAAAEPARLWLLIFLVAKSGLVAWAAAVSRAFGTSNLDRLRGWLRRTPVLGLALVAILVATLGWPGSAVYEARASIIRLALPDGLQFVFALSIVISAAVVARLLLFGLVTPSEAVRGARSELPKWRTGAAAPAAAVAVPGAVAASVTPEPAARAVPPAEPVAGAGGTAQAVEVDAKPRARASTAGSVPATLHLNRTPAVSLIVVAGAALAVALAAGGMGATNASRAGIPLDVAAHATPAQTPTASPSPTASPTAPPTLAPRPSGAPADSASPGTSELPSSSPGPIKTSPPARDNTD